MRRTNEVIDLTKQSGRQVLAELITSIDQVSVIKIWRHFITSIRHMISELDPILIF